MSSANSQVSTRIAQLKRERNAILLAHNYQTGDIQDVADFVGDSLGLAYRARETAADVILFAGVHFMAETAKIVNPTKTVLIPDLAAGCSLADSCAAADLARWRAAHPAAVVVAYINCSAAVKAQSDIICTSGNAVKVVNSIPRGKTVLFCPDENLGQWVMEQTGRQLLLWPGVCHVHVKFTSQSLQALRAAHPDARVVAHPECLPIVRSMADEVCSTEKMLAYCKSSSAQSFIIVTEAGMLHRLRKELPERTFIAGPTDTCSCNECEFMKKNTLAKCVAALESLQPEITLPEPIRRQALVPIQRMLALGR